MSADLTFSDATSLAEMIRTREVSPVEVMQAHLNRIEEINPKLNAIVSIASDALHVAKAAEAAVLRGEVLGPLHGVPFTVDAATPGLPRSSRTGTPRPVRTSTARRRAALCPRSRASRE
jgi:aspartyl-tRNA(Asn)/glutamyl-tRNA(Gln) amidotransferase subunit A